MSAKGEPTIVSFPESPISVPCPWTESSPGPPSRFPVTVEGIVPRSIEIESAIASVSTEIVLIPAPGQVAVCAVTAVQVPVGVRFAAESVTS